MSWPAIGFCRLTRLALSARSRIIPTVVRHGRVNNMMTIRRLSVGSGYKYLLKSIAVGDGPEDATTSNLVRYYTETGTPPGVFLGSSLAGLDGGRGVVFGQVVTAENLKRMLQGCADPITGEVLGRAPSAKAVGGFDLTFSPSKSVAVAWALADPKTRDVIYHCHQQAITTVLGYAEREVFKTRSGTRGCVEEDVLGVVAAGFTHFDSRDGDPQLHDHVVVWNRVQTASDGAWRALDSRGLFASAVMLSELHQGVLSDLLTKELGWDWEPHARRSSPVPKWEVVDVPAPLMEEFSRRTADIVAAKDELIERFEADHGRAPTDVEVLKLRQTATLATRHAKQGKSLGQLTKDWSTRALPYLDDEPTAWVHELAHRVTPAFASSDFADAILRDVANAALEVVSTKRATFSRANVQAEVLRQLQGVRFAQPSERIMTATRTTDLALGEALLLSTPNLRHTPRFLLRRDGTSKFEATGHWRYTTATLLDAEARLLTAAERFDAPSVAHRTVSAVTARPLPGRFFALSSDQARCVGEVASSARYLDVLVGPAGTGKSTAMAGLRAMWERDHGGGSVIALAPSAAAAEVLSEDMGLEADTLAKWLYEHRQCGQRRRELRELRQKVRSGAVQRISSRRLRENISRREDELRRWSLRRDQLVIVDEASLAATFDLDELVSATLDVGVKLLLVGDPAQLSAIEAGGMFRTLVRERGHDIPTLVDVRRFKAAWERRTTLQVRDGDVAALAAYRAHGRISEGSRDELLDTLYLAWKHDVDAGLHSLMLAGDAATVEELNDRARAELVARGVVGVGVVVGDLEIGAGDLIVTRENDRRLRTASGWVKNGDEWRVTATHQDGSLGVARVKGMESVVLPARYVAQHVELAYASTVHRAQGRTVDTAHAFISPFTTREVLYVSVTRGSTANQLYVDTNYDPDPTTGDDELTEKVTARDVLESVLHRESADVSATDMIRSLQQHSIATLVAEYETIVTLADGDRWEELLRDAGLGSADLARAQTSDAYHSLLARLREAESRGFDAREDLSTLVNLRSFSDAEDVASTLAYRIGRYVSAMGYPDLTEDQLVAGLFPRASGITDGDALAALKGREIAIEERACYLSTEAIERGDAWVRDFGAAPELAEPYKQWFKEVCAGAAYVDLWKSTSFSTVGTTDFGPHQRSQRDRVLGAIERAQTIGRAGISPGVIHFGPSSGEFIDPSTEFAIDR